MPVFETIPSIPVDVYSARDREGECDAGGNGIERDRGGDRSVRVRLLGGRASSAADRARHT
ncbi:hypothetical protein BRC77_09520 [Halobacteriales archaeon QH_8_64_26]|nr:MAG: hypothetical protein BRC77_09520 [Halobacteriales archaeon QH_8_64_26]